MSETNAIDTIRWTFSIDPSQRGEVEAFLTEQGAEVFSNTEGQVVAFWDEPQVEQLDDIVAELWEVIGVSAEITHEEFSRTNLLVWEDEEAAEAPSEAA